MKKYLFRALTLLMVGSASVSFVACGSDGDDGGGATGGDITSNESSSAVLGTWANTTSDDLNYILCFNADGTGYYIVEGTKDLNFTTFSKREFKFTTAELLGTASSVANVTGVKASGSIEMNYIGSSSAEYASFVLTETGKLQFEGLKNIEKSIFTQTPSLTNTVDIKGLWQGSFSEAQLYSENLVNTYSAFMRIDENGTGYLNNYNYVRNLDTNNFSSFNGDVIPFTSYVVTGDIVAFKLKDETSTTDEEVIVGLLRYKKNAANGYNISINGSEEVDVYPISSTTDITSNVQGIWVDESEENVMLASANKNLIYLKKNNNPSGDSFSLNDSIVGPYSLLDYNIKVDKSRYLRGKFVPEYRYILADISSVGTSNLGIYGTSVYHRFTKVPDGSAKLTGRWKLDTEITDNQLASGAIIDNNNYNVDKLYQLEFSGNNLFYAFTDEYATDYRTCYYIATNGRLFVLEKASDGASAANDDYNYSYGSNYGSTIRKQYSWEVVGSKLYLKYSVDNYTYSGPEEHVIIYTK